MLENVGRTCYAHSMTQTENVIIQMTKTQATHLTWLLGAMRFDWAEQQGVGRNEVDRIYNIVSDATYNTLDND